MDKDQKHIPFAVIVAATNGDEAAIQEILDFYDGYISKLSLRKLYDEYGNVYMVVDSECQTAHCGRGKSHFIFGGLASPIVPYRNLTQTTDGITADCRSLV